MINTIYNKHDTKLKLIKTNEIIDQWETDRYNIAKSIKNIELLESNYFWNTIIPYDNKCQSCLGKKCKPYIMKKSCSGCFCLSNLFKYGEIIAKKFIANKKEYIIENEQLCNLSGYIKTDQPNIEGNKIISYLELMDACEINFSRDIKNTIFMSLQSDFKKEQYIITSSFIEKEMSKIDMPCLPSFKWVYQCNNEINIIEEELDNFSYKLINEENIINFIKQLLSIIHFLNRYNFTHGKALIDLLKIDYKPCDYKYNNIEIKCDFTIRFIPSINSCFSTISNDGKNIRLFNKSDVINIDLFKDIEIIPNLLNIENSNCESCNINNKLLNEYSNRRYMTYRINNSYSTYTNSLGIPLFHSSFDLYSFLISLLSNKNIYEIFMNNNILVNWLKDLFLPSQYLNLIIDLEKLHLIENISYQLIINLLSKYHLRCNSLKLSWDIFSII